MDSRRKNTTLIAVIGIMVVMMLVEVFMQNKMLCLVPLERI